MTTATTRWLRYRFESDAEDARPVTFPPPGPYWQSGSVVPSSNSILIAYLPADMSLWDWWPEATAVTVVETPEGPQFSDRFPRPEWWT